MPHAVMQPFEKNCSQCYLSRPFNVSLFSDFGGKNSVLREPRGLIEALGALPDDRITEKAGDILNETGG